MGSGMSGGNAQAGYRLCVRTESLRAGGRSTLRTKQQTDAEGESQASLAIQAPGLTHGPPGASIMTRYQAPLGGAGRTLDLFLPT